MPLPDLESLTPSLDTATVTLLGDTIAYAADGATFANIKVFADLSEQQRDYGMTAATVQEMSFEMRVVDAPVRPGDTVRIMIPKIPGKVYHPRNVGLTEGGTFWHFGLKEVRIA